VRRQRQRNTKAATRNTMKRERKTTNSGNMTSSVRDCDSDRYNRYVVSSSVIFSSIPRIKPRWTPLNYNIHQHTTIIHVSLCRKESTKFYCIDKDIHVYDIYTRNFCRWFEHGEIGLLKLLICSKTFQQLAISTTTFIYRLNYHQHKPTIKTHQESGGGEMQDQNPVF